MEQLLAAVAALKDAEQKRAVALALAEDRDQRRAQNAAALLKLIEQHQALLDKAMKRIDTLETRQFWLSILGPVGLLLGLMAGAF